MSDHKHHANDQSKQIDELKTQISELKSELSLMYQKQDKTYKMIESIATSQNDLETNVYKAIMKIYNKIDDKKSSGTNTSRNSRDMSPISFQQRSSMK